jgi:hypothetical protein
MFALLLPEQKDLLVKLVEASRNSAKRQQFLLSILSNGSSTINHPGLPNGSIKFYMDDIEILCKEGLILLSRDFFDVTPKGFVYCDAESKPQSGQSLQILEEKLGFPICRRTRPEFKVILIYFLVLGIAALIDLVGGILIRDLWHYHWLPLLLVFILLFSSIWLMRKL